MVVLVQLQPVQNIIKNKAVGYLHDKLGTRVSIGRVSVIYPKDITIDDVFLADQSGDTLLYSHRLAANLDLPALIHSEVRLRSLDLDRLTANVVRKQGDSSFNFSYILKAFASKTPAPKTEADTAALKVTLGAIDLEHIKLSYKDALLGYDAQVYFGKLLTHIGNFDLKHMHFTLRDLNLSDLTTAVIVSAPLTAGVVKRVSRADSVAAVRLAARVADSARRDSAGGIQVVLNNVQLTRNNIRYKSKAQGLDTQFDLGDLLLSGGMIDLGRQRVKIGTLTLDKSRSSIRLLKTASSAAAAAAGAGAASATGARDATGATGKPVVNTPVTLAATDDGWKADVASLNLGGDTFSLDNDTYKPAKTGMDYNHLLISNLNLKSRGIHYEPRFSSLQLEKLVMHEKCGFEVKKGSGKIFYSDKKIMLGDFNLVTGESQLKANAALDYPSLAAISQSPGLLKLSVVVDPSTLGLKDVLYFQPSLATTDPFKHGASTRINMNAQLGGSVKDLTITRLEASALGRTHLLMSGKILGLPDPSKLILDLDVRDLRSSSLDIKRLVSRGTIPSSVHLPQQMNATSTLKGTLANFIYNVNLKSSLGNIVAAGYLKLGPKGRDTAYKIALTARAVQAGILSGQPKMLGVVNLNLNAEGKGLSLARANTSFQAQVMDAYVKGYRYTGLTMNGKVAARQASVKGSMNDRNLSFKVLGSADMRRKVPAFKLALNLDSANLKALHFSTTTSKVHADLLADIPSADINHPEGRIDLTHFLMVTDSASIPFDTLTVLAHTEGSKKSIRIRSEFLKAALDGEISLADISEQLTAQLDRYYAFTKPVKRKIFPPADFTFKAILLGPPSLHKLVPQLASFSHVHLDGMYQSATSKLVLNVGAPRTQYSDITIDSLRMHMTGDANRLNYEITVDSVSASGFELQQTQLAGFAADSKLHLGLSVTDEKKRAKYALASLLSEDHGIYRFSFLPEGVVLNYDRWTVPAGNLIEYSPQGIRARDVKLSHEGSDISVSSLRQEFNAPLRVKFDHFDLGTLSRFIEKDLVLVRGTLDGTAEAENLLKSLVFTSDLVLKDFSYRKDTLGTVTLKVNNQTAGAYAASVGISGKGNQALLTGLYYTKGSSFNFNFLINRLNLASIEAYTFGQIKQPAGYLNGKFQISGTSASPLITGNLGFRQAAFNLTYLNSVLHVPDQDIDFDARGIHLNDFTLLDSAKNKLSIDGDVLTKNYQNYTFDLTVSSTDFRVLNTTIKDNPNYYGKVYLNSDIDITGDLNKPIIDANITLNKRTNFTYAIPADDPSLEDRKGIVEFVSAKDSVLSKPRKTTNNKSFQGLDFSANLDIDRDAAFTVIIDQQTGDALKVKGQGTLNTTIDPSGKISLTGRYEIGEGSYQLTVNNFIKKSFTIKSGSTITWTGEPTLANVDITAVYIANAPSIDLMEQQVTDPTAATKYKQKLPFNLNLIMKGELLKPIITFSIDLPEKEANLNAEVKARLDQLKQDPNELNKQVFALLLLNRFVGQNPLQSQAGGGMNAGLIARQSAGKLLSQQLNSLAGSLIKGVDLNFNLNSQENYTTGTAQTRTDLQVGATKNFNDRLSVSIGTDINLEGSQQTNPNATGLIGDVNVEYKLSRDGRYRLRAFRRNATEEFVEGQFIETGVSFLFVVDYDKFKDAFKSTKVIEPGIVAPRKPRSP